MRTIRLGLMGSTSLTSLTSLIALVGCSGDPPAPSDAASADVAVEDRAAPPADAIVEDRAMPPAGDAGPPRCTSVADCDDGVACTEDRCGMDGVCAHTETNARCDDGLFCNGAERCDAARGCVAGTAPACDDMNANTADRCDPGANACRNDPLDNDGDGDPAMSAGGRDCDDNDRTRSSLEREVCNGRDDNCNGMTDEGALNACGNCDPSCRAVSTGGMGGMPFSDPGRRGVELDPMAAGLLVRAESRTGDFLWIPNVNESTLSKWDATTGTELARYRVGLASGECRGICCHNNGCNMPSRTVVDGFGDAYVANRAFGMQGTVTKIAADRRDCVDRNGNGMIDTSTSATDVRPFGQDECVLWTSNVGPVNATLRAIAIDRGDPMAPQGYPWVGSCPNSGTDPGQSVWKLDPRTGAVIRTVGMPWGCSYGAVGLADGSVWFHRYGGFGGGLVRLDTTTNTTSGPFTNTTVGSRCTFTYGITADANGRLWMSGIGCNAVVGYDPATNRWTEADIGATTGLGITVDPMNNVWTQLYPSGSQLIRIPAAAFTAGGTIPAAMIARIPRPGAAFGQGSAIGADRANNIWITTSDGPPTSLIRYEPSMSRFTSFTGPNRVYTYTDFTGSVRRTVIGTGTYTQEYDTMCEAPVLSQLAWDSVTPMGTSLSFALQTAATAAGLGGAVPTTVAIAPRDASPRDLTTTMVSNRRFVRLTVTFNPTTMPVASPVLRGLNLSWRCPYGIPGA
jgi:hypothetical protein